MSGLWACLEEVRLFKLGLNVVDELLPCLLQYFTDANVPDNDMLKWFARLKLLGQLCRRSRVEHTLVESMPFCLRALARRFLCLLRHAAIYLSNASLQRKVFRAEHAVKLKSCGCAAPQLSRPVPSGQMEMNFQLP
jgi:hypothetical protein